ncbi:hypothetical protein LguiB_006723 [Lonicera macranthoides]
MIHMGTCSYNVILILLVLTCLWINNGLALDSLKPGDSIDLKGAVQSANGKWNLGFFPLSGNMYLGTYQLLGNTTGDKREPFFSWITGTFQLLGNSTGDKHEPFFSWIANKNDPMDKSAVLTLDLYGSLKIKQKGENGKNGKNLTIYSPKEATNRIVGTLLDSGNFILEEVDSNQVLWQSFDYPMDSLLPGMKLGVNHKTGHSRALTTWLTDTIPTDGSLTLTWEQGQLVARRRGVVHWTSGVLINNRFEYFSDDAEGMYEYKIVSNEEEESFSFTSNRENSAWVLFPDGWLMDPWAHGIANSGDCYGYETDGGCKRWEQPVCRSPSQKFELKSFDTAGLHIIKNSDPSTNLSIDDCKATCWSNCNCSAFATLYTNFTGCTYFSGSWSLSDLSPGSYSIYLLLKQSSHKGTKKTLRISAAAGSALIIVLLCILCLALKKMKGRGMTKMERAKADLEGLDKFSEFNQFQNVLKKEHGFRVYSYQCVLEATSSFSITNKLGEGGFGPVYKGMLPEGREIAVKRLSKRSGQGIIEFKNELTLISELQHVNLVHLRGCCIHEEEMMLIYEYQPNKSLDIFLFDSTRSKLLDWNKRFNIIEGIAQGLLYLHKYSRLRVVHRDLKASNILLDENMNPKISDFGMAKMFQQHESHEFSKRIVGTLGYISPEFAQNGIFSMKSDVYSFGVLMLEIVSGRRNTSFYKNSNSPLNLMVHDWNLWKEGAGLEMIDQVISDDNSCNEAQVMRCIHIGLLCVEEHPKDRPMMSEIMSMLTNESITLPPPKRPAFCLGDDAIKALKSHQESKSGSVNGLSITYIEAR